MKRLVPRPLPQDPLPDSARADIDRLLTVATTVDTLDRDDAATLWRRHSAQAGTDQDILAALLSEADMLELPDPPTGFASWVDYAVDCTDIRSAELEYLLSDEAPPPNRE